MRVIPAALAAACVLTSVSVAAQEERHTNADVPNFQVLPPVNEVETIFKPGESVLIVGDSLVAGTGVPKNQSFPALFDEWTPARITAEGKAGETSAQLLKRIGSSLKREQYRWVIVCTGGNDILRDQADGTLKRNLIDIITEIRRAGARAVLMAVPDPRTHVDLPVYRAIGSSMRVPVLENVGSKLTDRHFLADGVHPNAEGYKIVAEELMYLFAKVDPRPKMPPPAAVTQTTMAPAKAEPEWPDEQKAPGAAFMSAPKPVAKPAPGTPDAAAAVAPVVATPPPAPPIPPPAPPIPPPLPPSASAAPTPGVATP